MMINRENLVNEARTWLGVRFRHQGRTRNGVDCIGLLIAVAQNALEIAPVIINNYGRRPHQQDIFNDIKNHLNKIDRKNLQPGDIVQMRLGQQATHFGMFTGPSIIHSAAIYRKVVEHSFSSDIQSTVIACYAIPGVD